MRKRLGNKRAARQDDQRADGDDQPRAETDVATKPVPSPFAHCALSVDVLLHSQDRLVPHSRRADASVFRVDGGVAGCRTGDLSACDCHYITFLRSCEALVKAHGYEEWVGGDRMVTRVWAASSSLTLHQWSEVSPCTVRLWTVPGPVSF